MSKSARMPTLFISHGPGPMFYAKSSPTDKGFAKDCNVDAPVTHWYRQLAQQMGLVDGGKYGKPKALVVFSAHWETPNNVWITSNRDMKLFYDYYGFDKYLYDIEYPAKGDPELARRVFEILKKANIDSKLDESRNYDRGVFVPLKLVFPDADIPIIQISLREELNPTYQVQIGKALSHLREEGILIIGSGQLTHNFSTMNDKKENEVFTQAITGILTSSDLDNETRLNTLLNWESIPNARKAHAREEHLLPLHTAAAAAGGSKATKLNNHWAQGMSLECFSFEE